MKNKKYTFGDITFEIDNPFGTKDNDNCEEFLSDKKTDYLIRICVSKEESEYKRKIEKNGNVITKYLKNIPSSKISTASILAASEAAFLFLNHDAFILHASYIIHKGQAILFTAPSGVGKSTQANLWIKERGAKIVNGDRVLITKRNDHFYANGIYAHGTSSISKNLTAPIRAVILLEQGDCNMINEIPPRYLFLRIMCECSFDMNDYEQYKKITELVSDMINTLPVFCYRCKKSPDAVEALERILWNRK